jgi:two-component system nitrogen regulation sensor histidine kinase NtrY
MLTEVKIKSLYQNIENLLFIFIFFISFVISLIIFLSLSGYLLNLGQVEDVSILISINFFLIILLILISLNKIFKIFIEKKLKSKFRIQFTSLFIIISFIPTSLITIFSLVFFDQGVKNWFNDKISRVIDGSKEISESYFNEHKNSIKKDILFINNELSSEEVFFFTNRERLTEFLNYFVEVRELDEAIIFESSGQLLAKVGSFLAETETAPPLWTFFIADEGDIAVFPNNDQTKVRALLKIQRALPTYLYIGKNVDSNVLSRVESVNKTALEYVNVTNKLDDFQYQFNKLFLAINFLMIILSTWFGLKFSSRILGPILSIIKDTEKIIQDNFSSKIRVIEGNNEFNFLSKVLNKMIEKLKVQKNKLLKAKETINLRRKFTEKIINEISNAIIYIDTNNKILLMNKKTEEFLGPNTKNNFFKINRNLSSEIKKFKNSINDHKVVQIKHLIVGKIKILNLNLSKVYENKLFKGVLLSIDDITELVSAQKNVAWSNIARYMAHEIKNPLTPIKLSAQRIENSVKDKKGSDADFFNNCTSTIVRQVNSIENLVSEFSNFARMPERKLKLVSLDNLILNQVNTQKIANKNAEFKLKIKPKKINISCDFNQINRLFMNILKNSIESNSKKKKKVHITVSKKSNFFLVDIEDNGDGFPKNREKLFEPYITHKLNGTGLGLAICKKIVEDHNGEIDLLDGDSLGGALVRIKLFKNINIYD